MSDAAPRLDPTEKCVNCSAHRYDHDGTLWCQEFKAAEKRIRKPAAKRRTSPRAPLTVLRTLDTTAIEAAILERDYCTDVLLTIAKAFPNLRDDVIDVLQIEARYATDVRSKAR